jgi:hypothetical protein
MQATQDDLIVWLLVEERLADPQGFGRLQEIALAGPAPARSARLAFGNGQRFAPGRLIREVRNLHALPGLRRQLESLLTFAVRLEAKLKAAQALGAAARLGREAGLSETQIQQAIAKTETPG